MPRLPDYDAKVEPVGGGVQPGSPFLPNIHLESGLTQQINKIGSEAEEAGRYYSATQAKEQHAQRVIEGGNAMGELLRGSGVVMARHQGSTDPEAPTLFRQDMDQLINTSLEKVSPENRPWVASHMAQHVGQMESTFTQGYAQRIRQLTTDQGMDNLKTFAVAQVDAELANDPAGAAAKMGAAHGYATELENMGLTNTKKGEAVKQYDKIVGKVRFDKMIQTQPDLVMQKLQTPEGRAYFGIEAGQETAAMNTARGQATQQQNEIYQSVLNGFANKQFPTDAQFNRLSGGQKLAVQNLMKNLGNTDDQITLMNLGPKLIQLKSDPLPENIAAGQALYQEVLRAPGLSIGTRLDFLSKIQAKINNAQSSGEKFIDGYLTNFRPAMSDKQYGLMMNQWILRPDGLQGMPKDAPLKDQMQYINKFALPFVQSSTGELMNKGNKPDLGKALLDITPGGQPPAPKVQELPPPATAKGRIFRNSAGELRQSDGIQWNRLK